MRFYSILYDVFVLPVTMLLIGFVQNMVFWSTQDPMVSGLDIKQMLTWPKFSSMWVKLIKNDQNRPK